MSTLTGQYISQSYTGLIKTSTNAAVSGITQLEDGAGNALGTYVNTNGLLSAANVTSSGNAYINGAPIGRGTGTGVYNLVWGWSAANEPNSGSRNVTIGDEAGLFNASSSYNTIVGNRAASGIQNGEYNTYLGYYAAGNFQTGNNNVVIGARLNSVFTPELSSSVNFNNNIIIGTGDGSIKLWFTGSEWFVSGSARVQRGVAITTGDLSLSSGNINVTNGNILQAAGATFLRNTTITGSLNVSAGITGSLLGTSSFATSASFALSTTSASYALSSSLSANSVLFNGSALSTFARTGSNTFVGNQTISGSVKNEVRTLTISSNTASMDFNTGNFFTLTLAGGANTFLNPTNIQAGQTVNLQITQVSPAGTLSFPSSVSFPSGSYYTASIANNDVDVISMISFNGTAVRAVASKTFL